MNLRETEALLHALITAPEGVSEGLRQLGQNDAALDGVLVGDARRGAVARLDVYANMYFFRILDVLREDFPKLVAAVGDQRFHDLVTDYLIAHPPRSPSLGEAGAALPTFLAARGEAWCAELAELEHTRSALFIAEDAAPLAFDEVRALAPDALTALPLALIPAHARLTFRHAVDEFWSNGLTTDASGLTNSPTAARHVLVWRQGTAIFHRPITAREAAWLDAIAGGELSFGALCERIAADAPEGEPATTAFQFFSQLLTDELLRRPAED